MLPPMIHVVVAPPAPVAPPGIADPRRVAQTSLFDISVTRGDALLWRGRLRAATGGPATFSQQINESFACRAANGQNGSGRSLTGLSVSFYPIYGSDDLSAVRVTARFQRPSSENPPTQCDQAFARVIELEGTIHPELGRSIVLTADGGYAVSVTLVSRDMFP